MGESLTLWSQPLETHVQADPNQARLLVVEGTLQRVNYARRELNIVAQGRIWSFHLAADCQLRFDDQPAILRCFHPLDRVRVVYEASNGALRAQAMQAWEKVRMVS